MKKNLTLIFLIMMTACFLSSCSVSKIKHTALRFLAPDYDSLSSAKTLLSNIESNTDFSETASFEVLGGTDCNLLLNSFYNTLNVTSDQSYVATLVEIYNYDQSRYNQKRSSSGWSAVLPEWGSANYNQAKQSANGIHTRYSGSNSYSLTKEDHLALNVNHVNDQVRMAQFDAFIECVTITSLLPRLELISHSATSVMLQLYLPPNAHARRTKVSDIQSSPNLVSTNSVDPDLPPGVRRGQRVNYGSSYSIVFNRTDKRPASVIVNLAKEQPLSLNIPAVDTTVYGYELRSTDENGNPYRLNTAITIHWKKKYVATTDNNGNIVTKPYNRSAYVSALIETGLNLDSTQITGVFPRVVGGDIKGESYQLITGTGTRNVDVLATIRATKASPTRINYTIDYKKLRRVCIANCPEGSKD